MSARNASPPALADDHDSPWKDALELYFPQALALLTPDLYSLIDGSVPVEFLDKELQAILASGSHGRSRRLADKLGQVRLREGGDALLLIHVEVQGRLSGPVALRDFSGRMMEYQMLIRMSFRHRHGGTGHRPRVYSLGILINQPCRQAGRPVNTHLEYQDDFLGQTLRFTFPVVELAQWRDRWDELDRLASSNPFAVIIMAQLRANQYRDKSGRLAPLIDLVRRLYGYGHDRDQVARLLRLVEWMISLPPGLETDYLQAVQRLEQERKMSYVTIAERYGIKKGMEQGLAKGRVEGRVEGQADLLLRQILRKFETVPDEVVQRIQSAADAQLETWALNILDADTLDDVFRD